MSQPPGNIEHDVLTTDNVNSFVAAVKQADKALKAIEAKTAHNAQLQKVHIQLSAKRDALLKRAEKMREDVKKNTKKSEVRGLKELTADTKTYLKEVVDASKKDYRTVYRFGTQKVADDSGMKSAIKAAKKLPDTAEKYIPQAVNDLWAGRGKATSGVGAGVLHASAGKAAVKDNSCTIFFTRVMHEGKETVTVLAVGSHATSNTYTIYISKDSKFTEGKVVKI